MLLPEKQFTWAEMPVLGVTPKLENGFSTWMPRMPLARTLPLTVTLLSPPKRSMVPLGVEPMLVLPLIVELRR